ncbi:MAG: efflux RND transporter periplasmic adaptor subunit [Candidatus Hydrogenedentes bacterium]|nr:efflux RND transporter periplasmic adaptor subunit [Candidatus Hydrogenedentota bacterium]
MLSGSSKTPWFLAALLGLITLQADAQQQGPPPPPQVGIVTVTPAAIPVNFEYVGVAQPSQIVEVRARVQGYLESRQFEEGALVNEGEPLFTIDPRSFDADLQIAQARTEQAETRLKLATQDVARLQSVNVPGAIAASDVDAAMAEQAAAAAALRLAKAEHAKAELEMSYTKINAPITGYVDKAELETGSLVEPNRNNMLTRMRKLDPLYVSFGVSERDFLTWRNSTASGELALPEGKDVELELTLLDGSSYAHHGTVDYQSSVVDLQTGAVEMRGTFPNPDFALKPGQFLKVSVTGYVRANAIAVPQRAVGQSPQGPYVFVIGPENKVELRSVTLGQWAGENWLIEGGLAAGDRVIAEGLIKVQPGIEVVSSPYAGAPPADTASQAKS